MIQNVTWKDAWTALGDILVPRGCVVCGRILGMHEECLCAHCASDLPQTYYWTMPRNPMADRLNARIQEAIVAAHFEGSPLKDASASALTGGEKMRKHQPYAMAAALFFYRPESPYKALTRRLKYTADLRTGRFVARLLADRLAASPLFCGDGMADGIPGVDGVVPVPLHWTRRMERGYNQAEVIAREVADRLGVPVLDLLERRRRTKTQTRLDAAGKKANVSGAFALRQPLFADFSHLFSPGTFPPGRSRTGTFPGEYRHLLLIDDVCTTGATLAACYAALRTVFPPPGRISVATLGCVP